QDILGQYGDKLVALHLHDNDGSADQHNMPGEGTISWHHITANLRRLQYKGSICLEVVDQYNNESNYNSAMAFLHRAQRKAQKFARKISRE
ncbi:MAG: sugar phosphate isomerase/epimerase, partial [Clostridiales bacterium]|nr:sugar phosphate isomerase/epimerase [Clostridiales bacterium]